MKISHCGNTKSNVNGKWHKSEQERIDEVKTEAKIKAEKIFRQIQSNHLNSLADGFLAEQILKQTGYFDNAAKILDEEIKQYIKNIKDPNQYLAMRY